MKPQNNAENFLKVRLCKLLPEQIEIIQNRRFLFGPKNPPQFYWLDTCEPVTPREWLHVCAEAEKKLIVRDFECRGFDISPIDDYRQALANCCARGSVSTAACLRSQSASWQQRACCLIEVFEKHADLIKKLCSAKPSSSLRGSDQSPGPA